MKSILPVVTISAVLLTNAAQAEISEKVRASIDQITGTKGAYTAEEDVHRVSFPRSDLKVTIESRPAHPFMGFGSWAAFTPGHRGTMVMGDIVLLEDEVSPAMSAALDNGLEVTALHNHFFFESPRVMYMHISGSGDPAKLATAVRKVIDAQRAVRASSADPARAFAGKAIPTENKISAAPIDQILRNKGEMNNGMYKVTIGRAATHHGAKIGKQMGVNTWAAFAGTDDMASVDGDFAMTEDELQGVLKALRSSGIHIVAIHNHMTHEQPRFVFLHYWGKGPAQDLARAVRSALDTQQK
ncbi:MAG TPA: DUF1259 domain-containing protein [Bryobacteraceae bacterium]|jgi:hypothetical protein|nr:DUF1259 domain-containing protein [Bryobacteraceae bacterium]